MAASNDLVTVPEGEGANRWGATTKLVVGAALLVIALAFVVRFQNLVTPLLMAFILSYLLFPLIKTVRQLTRLPWKLVANVVFLVVVLVVLAAFGAVGVVTFQQLTNLIALVEEVLLDLPSIIASIGNNLPTSISIFGFTTINVDEVLNLQLIDAQAVAEELLRYVQPALTQAGSLVGTVATATASFLGWGFLVLMISYFSLVDLSENPRLLSGLDLPGISGDLRELLRRTGRIWNGFIRGQFVLALLSGIAASLLMSALGVRFALAIGVIAGLARFIPYFGTLITLTAAFIVTIFQPSNYLGLDPLWFALVATAAEAVLDAIIDNGIMPRLFGAVLGVHPAAVLVSAVVSASILGLVGVLLAAPMLATAQLVGRFVVYKLLDLDPWADPPPQKEDAPTLARLLRRLRPQPQEAVEAQASDTADD